FQALRDDPPPTDSDSLDEAAKEEYMGNIRVLRSRDVAAFQVLNGHPFGKSSRVPYLDPIRKDRDGNTAVIRCIVPMYEGVHHPFSERGPRVGWGLPSTEPARRK